MGNWAQPQRAILGVVIAACLGACATGAGESNDLGGTSTSANGGLGGQPVGAGAAMAGPTTSGGGAPGSGGTNANGGAGGEGVGGEGVGGAGGALAMGGAGGSGGTGGGIGVGGSGGTGGSVGCPPAPTNPSGCPGCSTFCDDPWNAAWSASAGATHYIVEYQCFTQVSSYQTSNTGADLCTEVGMCNNNLCANGAGPVSVKACNAQCCSQPVTVPDTPTACGGGVCC